jgi:GNAT superfamily N-acetyltransferase
MFSVIRTDSNNVDYIKLTKLFDEFLIDIDGDEKDFFAQFNNIYIKQVIVCFHNNIAVGCGAFKEYEPNVAELKRMFVLPEYRGKGVATKIIFELENWAQQENYTISVLETSIRLLNAIALYKKTGYKIIPNYGQYIGVESSVCMRKELK